MLRLAHAIKQHHGGFELDSRFGLRFDIDQLLRLVGVQDGQEPVSELLKYNLYQNKSLL